MALHRVSARLILLSCPHGEGDDLEPRSMRDALETVIAAARAYAQILADDADRSPEEEAEEAAIWSAIELLSSWEG